MQAAIYSRKSKFTGKGESIENQVQFCKEYCLSHSIEIYNVYEDEGFSGGNVKRPEYQQMLKDAKNKKFNILICYRLDRISRNISNFSNLITELDELNINFVSIREQFDTSTPLGRAMMYISSVFAQFERETIAERIKDNMHQLARNGRWLGGKCPIGFKSEQVKFMDRDGKERRMNILSPVSEELKTVKLLFDKYYELSGIHKLEGYCIKNNIKSKTGSFFEPSALLFVLTNPVYVKADTLIYDYCKAKSMDIASSKEAFDGSHGLMVYNKRNIQKGKSPKLKDLSEWIVSIGAHEGVIESDLWIKVQNMIEHHPVKAPRSGTSKISLLTPILTCANCGTPMRASYKYIDGKIIHHYYKCRLKERSRGINCSTQNLNGTEAEEQVLNYLKKIVLNQGITVKEVEKKLQCIRSTEKNASIEKNKLRKSIIEKELSIENLTRELSKNSDSSAASYIIKQIELIDHEIKSLKTDLYKSLDKDESPLLKQINIQFIQEQLEYLNNNSELLSFDEKKRLILGLIKKITWDGEKLKITLLDSK